MPFLTEELWQQTGEGEAQLMTLAPWPRFADSLVDAEADATLGWVVRVIGQIRAVRSEMNVPPGARIALIVNDASTDSKARLADHEAQIGRAHVRTPVTNATPECRPMLGKQNQ